MDINEKVKRALEGLDLIDPEVRILENRGSRVLVGLISPSFEQMEDGDRQAMVWGKLIDDLGYNDSSRVEYVFTRTPRELEEDIAQATASAPDSPS